MKFFWFRLSFQLFFFIGWRALRALRSPLPIELRIHPGNRALGPRADRSKNDGEISPSSAAGERSCRSRGCSRPRRTRRHSTCYYKRIRRTNALDSVTHAASRVVSSPNQIKKIKKRIATHPRTHLITRSLASVVVVAHGCCSWASSRLRSRAAARLRLCTRTRGRRPRRRSGPRNGS